MRTSPAGKGLLFLTLFISSVLSFGCETDREERSYKKAQEYWDQRLYGSAAEAYEQFALQFPKSEKAASSLCKAATLSSVYLHEYARAVQLYVNLIDRYPSSPLIKEARLHLAEIYEENLHEYAAAISQYQILLWMPNTPKPVMCGYWYRIGRNHFLMGELEEARKAYKRIIDDCPKEEDADRAAYQIGYLRYLQGNWNEAIVGFGFFLDRFPNSTWTFDAMIHLARSYEKRGEYSRAQSLYRRIIKRFPEKTEVQDHLRPVKRKPQKTTNRQHGRKKNR